MQVVVVMVEYVRFIPGLLVSCPAGLKVISKSRECVVTKLDPTWLNK